MTKDEIRTLLIGTLRPEDAILDAPTTEDWRIIEKRFDCVFPPEFKAFIELMSEFSFPGDIYNVVREGRTNGNDNILHVYEDELATGNWPKHLVPFYGIGNGDYFVLNSEEGDKSGVRYRYHEDGRVEPYSASFDEWLKQLPVFLNDDVAPPKSAPRMSPDNDGYEI